VIDLDEFFKVDRVIVLINVARLELVWLNDLPEQHGQSTEPALPDGVASHTGERCGGIGGRPLRRLLSSMIVTPWCYCSSYIISTVASTVFI
jgi:hypothetical protein